MSATLSYVNDVKEGKSLQEVARRADGRAREIQKLLSHPRLVVGVSVFLTTDLLSASGQAEVAVARIVRKKLRKHEIFICDKEVDVRILPASENFKEQFGIDFTPRPELSEEEFQAACGEITELEKVVEQALARIKNLSKLLAPKPRNGRSP